MFKFQPFTEHALENLAADRIHLSILSSLDDQFSDWCVEKKGVPNPDHERDRFLDVIGMWGFEAARAEDAKETYLEYLSELGDDCGFVPGLKRHARIACFSSECASFLMWVRRADRLRGFCVELDERSIGHGTEARICEVRYRTGPPCVEQRALALIEDMHWNDDDTVIEHHSRMIDEIIRRVLATKPIRMSYESEKRVMFFKEDDASDEPSLSYEPGAIRSVTVGELAAPENVEALRKILSSKGATFALRVARLTSEEDCVRIETV